MHLQRSFYVPLSLFFSQMTISVARIWQSTYIFFASLFFRYHTQFHRAHLIFTKWNKPNGWKVGISSESWHAKLKILSSKKASTLQKRIQKKNYCWKEQRLLCMEMVCSRLCSRARIKQLANIFTWIMHGVCVQLAVDQNDCVITLHAIFIFTFSWICVCVYARKCGRERDAYGKNIRKYMRYVAHLRYIVDVDL